VNDRVRRFYITRSQMPIVKAWPYDINHTMVLATEPHHIKLLNDTLKLNFLNMYTRQETVLFAMRYWSPEV